MKTLIAYFSHVGENMANGKITILEKGNTEKVAEKIHSLIESDLYKIEPKEAYSFSYRDCNARAKREDENDERPEILDTIGLNMNNYDVIYLGFPIWYRTFPRIIATFLSKYDFAGKTIIPFCTNDEEYFGIPLLELQSRAKDAILKEGLVIRGVLVDNANKQIEEFVNKNK